MSHRGPLRWVSDPVTTQSSPERVRALREQLEARGCRYWLGVFGYFDARKNLPLIIEAIIDQPDVGLLAAGTMGSGVGESIAPLIARFEANGGQVVTLSGALTDAEFDSAIATVDCVVLAYSTEGTSGIALKAAALGRRLILAGGTTIRQYAAQLGDQASWSPLDVNSLAEAILTSRTLPVPEARSDFGADEFLTEVTARF